MYLVMLKAFFSFVIIFTFMEVFKKNWEWGFKKENIEENAVKSLLKRYIYSGEQKKVNFNMNVYVYSNSLP